MRLSNSKSPLRSVVAPFRNVESGKVSNCMVAIPTGSAVSKSVTCPVTFTRFSCAKPAPTVHRASMSMSKVFFIYES